MEQLSGSMHQLLAELQASEALNDTLRQVEIDVRGLRRSWDTLRGQIAFSAVAGAEPSARGQTRTRPCCACGTSTRT